MFLQILLGIGSGALQGLVLLAIISLVSMTFLGALALRLFLAVCLVLLCLFFSAMVSFLINNAISNSEHLFCLMPWLAWPSCCIAVVAAFTISD